VAVSEQRGGWHQCSYETRGFGPYIPGMPMKMAKELCPEAIVIKGKQETTAKHSDIVKPILLKNTYLYFEKSSNR